MLRPVKDDSLILIGTVTKVETFFYGDENEYKELSFLIHSPQYPDLYERAEKIRVGRTTDVREGSSILVSYLKRENEDPFIRYQGLL